MSRIFFEKMSLDELTRRARIIVAATPTGEPANAKKLSLGKGVPAFDYLEHHYRVDATLKAPEPLAAGRALNVVSVSADGLRNHIDYAVRGLSRSYAVPTYEGAGVDKLGERAPRILFLSPIIVIAADDKGTTLSEVVNAMTPVTWGAVETMAAAENVASAVRAEAEAGRRVASSSTELVAVATGMNDKRERALVKQIGEQYRSLGGYSLRVIDTAPR